MGDTKAEKYCINVLKKEDILLITGSVMGEKTINNTINRSIIRIAFRTPIFIDTTGFIHF